MVLIVWGWVGRLRVGTAGESLAFLPAHCFFGFFGVCLCASCLSVDCGLFFAVLVVVALLRVWVSLGLVVNLGPRISY